MSDVAEGNRVPAPPPGLTAQLNALLVTQMLFNVGFYLVVPFLAIRMTQDLGAAGATVGLVLGIRTFSQQGLFFLGGGLADAFGVGRVLLAGVALRVAGFLVAGMATSIPVLVVGVVLIGFAAALFSPAVESMIATGGHELEKAGGPTRHRLFALEATWSRAGALLGPILGAILIPVGFPLVCFVGAGVFSLIFVLHAILLSRGARLRSRPAAIGGDGGAAGGVISMVSTWGRVLCNGPFMVFALLYSTYLVAYNQQYLALPVELRRATGSDELLGWFFALASVYVVATQNAIARLVAGWSRPVSLITGFGVMASSFAIVAAAAPFTVGSPLWSLVPAAVFLVTLHTGMMISVPVAKDLVGDLAGNRDLGSYYGFLNSFGGLAVLVCSVGLGRLLDGAEDPGPAAAVPWLVMAVLLAVSACGMFWQGRRTYRR